MDYSRRGVVKKQHEIKSTAKRMSSKIRINFFRLAIVAVVFVGIIGVMAIGGAAKGMVESSPDISQKDMDPDSFATHIYYSDGKLAQALVGAEANRVEVSIEEIPDILEHAFVALEDERFYEHDGIDIQGIFRAGFSVIKTQGLGFGASTITQQLIKIKVFNYGNEPNAVDKIVRKVQEQYLAIKLEDKLTKDEILEAYLNNINLGNGAFGVQTAAQAYFGKDVQDLTISEAAVLAPIALSPVHRNPLTNPERNAERRKVCLDNMLEFNYITQAEYDEAIADDVYSRIKDHNEQKKSETYYTYFTDELIEQVLADLINKKGYTSEEAYNLLYSGGLEIYSTQDRKIQKIMDKYFKDEANFPAVGEGSYYELNYALSVDKANGELVHYQTTDLIEYFKDFKDSDHLYYHETSSNVGINSLGYSKKDMKAKIEEFKDAMLEDGDTIRAESPSIILQPQTSMTIMDQHTGHVVALYGGRGEKTGNRTLNRATNARRQVGSTFKVLASFLPALDARGFTLASVMDDSEYTYPNSDATVINWNKQYKGLSTMREAVYNSMNIIACRFMEAVTPRLAFDYLQKLGFSLVESQTGANGQKYSDLNVSLALGSTTNGVTNMELTAGYASIANGGVYNEPVLYTKIVDHNGKVLLSNEPSSEQVFKSSTAWLLTSAMIDTVNKGTATRVQIPNMTVAGKTGTSEKDYDLWFAGFTPYYTAAIWTGFDYSFSQVNKNYHKDLWRNIMEEIHTKLKLENKVFEKPDSITTAVICTKSGQLAIPGVCDHTLGGDFTRTEYFAKGTAPTKYCTAHVKVSICTESNHLATPFCPLSSTKEVVYLIKTETSPTADTPYIYPTDERAEPCPIHSEGSIAPPTGQDDVTLPPENTDGDITETPVPDDTGDTPEETDPGTGDTGDTTVQPTTTPEIILP
jgi:penicillin-binding protein 1A